jgi:hypothetical protein
MGFTRFMMFMRFMGSEPAALLEEICAHEQIPDDDPFSERDSGHGAELGVAAFDELSESW